MDALGTSTAAKPMHSEHTVWLGGLPAGTPRSAVRALAQPFGEVRRAFLAGKKSQGSDHGGAKSPGTAAFVNFSSADAAAACVAALDGKRVSVGVSKKKDDSAAVKVKLAVKPARRRLRNKEDSENKSSKSSKSDADRTAEAVQSENVTRKAKRRSKGFLEDLVSEAQAHDAAVESNSARKIQKKQKKGKKGNAEAEEEDVVSYSAGSDSSDSESDSDSSSDSGSEAGLSKKVSEPAEAKSDLRSQLLARPDQLRRVIVRNMAFQCTEADLRKACEKFGKIEHIEVPIKADGKKRGFAFVRFSKISEALEAVEKLSGQKIKGRVLAVDRALPKDAFETMKATQAEQAIQAPAAEEDTEMSDAVVDKNEGEAVGQPTHSAEIVSGNNSKPADASENRTIFLTNLPHDATRRDVVDAMLPFVRAARQFMKRTKVVDPEASTDQNARPPQPISKLFLTRDKLTGVGRGSAFAHMATAALATATAGQIALASEQRADGCEARLPPFTVGGRTVRAQLAVDRDYLPGGLRHGQAALPSVGGLDETDATDAVAGLLGTVGMGLGEFSEQQRAFEAERQARMAAKHVQDKRNLYLANEGLVTPQDAKKMGLSEADVEKRVAARKDKKLKLATPNFSVSRTRLSVRNLPRDVDENMLRRVFVQQARDGLLSGFADDVHLRSGEERLCSFVGRDAESGEVQRKLTGKVELTQVKILRDKILAEAGNKEGSSKGIAFVEFTTHHASLAALRGVNNNPGLFGGRSKRPIVEFAVQDARKLKLHSERLERSRIRSGQANPGTDAVADNVREDNRSRAQEKKVSRLQERQKRKDDQASRSAQKQAATQNANEDTTVAVPRSERRREKRRLEEDAMDAVVDNVEALVGDTPDLRVRRRAQKRQRRYDQEFEDALDRYVERKAGVSM